MHPDKMLPWLKRAKSGERHVYHTGLHASNAPRVTVEVDDAPVAYRTSALAWLAYEAGLVLLFQQRIASHKFDYVAVRTRKPASDAVLAAMLGA